MTPLDVLIWAGVLAIAIILIALALGVAVTVVRTLWKPTPAAGATPERVTLGGGRRG